MHVYTGQSPSADPKRCECAMDILAAPAGVWPNDAIESPYSAKFDPGLGLDVVALATHTGPAVVAQPLVWIDVNALVHLVCARQAALPAANVLVHVSP